MAHIDFVFGIYLIYEQNQPEQVFKAVICRKIQLWLKGSECISHSLNSFVIRTLNISFDVACRHSAEQCINAGYLCFYADFGNCAVASCLVIESKFGVFILGSELPERDVFHFGTMSFELCKVFGVRLKCSNFFVGAFSVF